MLGVNLPQGGHMSIWAAAVALASSMLASLACVGPLIGIAMGLTGLGWMTQMSSWSLSVALLSLTLIYFSLILFKRRKICCISKQKHLRRQFFLQLSALLVLSLTIIDFIVIPSFA